MAFATREKSAESEPARETIPRPPRFDSDPLIVRAVAARQPAGAAALFARYRAHVRRVLVHVLGPDAELADLVQEVFVTAMSSIEGLADPASLRGWLGTIAVFTARARLRQRIRFRLFPLFPTDELPEVEHLPAAPEIDEALRAAYRVLLRMPEDERRLFALRFIDGMELAEIAKNARVSISTVKRRLSRAEARFSSIAGREPSLVDWLEGRLS